MSVYLSEILATYWPEASWSMLDEDYEQLNWNSEDIAKPTLEEVNQKIVEHASIKAFSILRRERDRLLSESDWTQMPDVPEATRTAWQTYRQALRDLPSTATPVMDNTTELCISGVTWPTKPE